MYAIRLKKNIKANILKAIREGGDMGAEQSVLVSKLSLSTGMTHMGIFTIIQDLRIVEKIELVGGRLHIIKQKVNKRDTRKSK